MSDNTKSPSLFKANKKKSESIDKRLLDSISIKKEIHKTETGDRDTSVIEQPRLIQKAEKKEPKQINSDGRQFNHRPSISADEGFFSIADKQARISAYLKLLVQLVDELSFVESKQNSILEEEKWNYNSDNSIPQIATSFNGILIQVLEDFVSHKSEREQEIFITALKKAVEKERNK